MKHLIKLLFVLLVMTCFSCTKDDDSIISKGELNSQKISQLIQDKTITSLSIYEWTYGTSGGTWSLKENMNNFKIESPFLFSIGGINYNGSSYYNLEYLTKFDYLGHNLNLYFKY